MDTLRSVFAFTQRDPSRATMIARGAIMIGVVTVLVAVLTAVGRGTFEDRVLVSVTFDDIGGALVTGDDVKVHGVIVGEISEIRAAEAARGAEVEVAIDPRHAEQVPGDVTARILPATVFGTTFIDLLPRSEGGVIRSGQRIEQDTSAETLELQAVLDGLDNVVTALGPAELATALNNLAGALDGNGEQLGRTIDTVATYLTRLNPRMPLVRENLDLLATNLELLEGYGDDLFDAVDDIAVASTTLVEQEGELTEVLTGGTKLFNALGRLLSENEKGLVDALFSTAVAVETLYEGREKLPRALLSTFDFVKSFSSALDEGPYLKIRSLIQLPARPTYTDADCPWFGDTPGRGCVGGAR